MGQLHHKVDLTVTLGGDGTVLYAASLFPGPMPPLISFAGGSLGFMTPFAPEAYEDQLAGFLRGPIELTLRHRLRARISRSRSIAPSDAGAATCHDCPGPSPCPSPSPSPSPAPPTPGAGNVVGDGPGGIRSGSGEQEEHRLVLNEVVIDRGMSPFLTNLECFCDGLFMTAVQGDGLIVSTPSGSTAYSLAAGGSMVHPLVPAILFTPVCPHSLSFRPLILPEFVTLRIQVPAHSRGQAWVSFDGKHRQALGPGDALVVQMSRWPVPAACGRDSLVDFMRGVKDGLHWNLRKEQGAGEVKTPTVQ
eukprot:jgi/Mesen1/6772/ME000348S06043